MEEVIRIILDRFKFELLKQDNDYIVVRGEKNNVESLMKTFNSIKEKLTTANIKVYHLGNEQNKDLLKIFLITKVENDSEKILALLKEN